MEAIAAADAATALTFVDTPPSDTSLLTDAVLEKSQQLAAISDISTTESNTNSVAYASYKMGDTAVTATFRLRAVPQGYAITNGIQKEDLSGVCEPCTGISINGAAITQSSVNVFPGTYQFGASSPLLAVTGDNFNFTGAPQFNWAKVSIKLAPGANATLGAAAQAVLDSCLQEKATPTRCGFGIPTLDGVTPAPDSITYTPDYSWAKPLTEVRCGLAQTSVTQAVCTAPIVIDYSVMDTSGEPFSGEINAFMEADIDISDPNHLVATLSSTWN